MSGKSFASLAIFWTALLCLSAPLAAQTPVTTDAETTVVESDHVEQRSSQPKAPLKILLILGLREEANQLVSISVFEELSGMDVKSIDADTSATLDDNWPEADVYLATGTKGCQVALESLKHQRILCTLLTEEGFMSLDRNDVEYEQLSALVIDQPTSRQATVANHIYPSLTRFSSFSSTEPWTDGHEQAVAVDNFSYINSRSLPTQLSDALTSHDALIATPDNRIYNSSTLSTVLLTAYGYHKPVIGFSRGYVKAGALLTCYTTPSQILREVSQLLNSGFLSTEGKPTISYPRYFSVIENLSVAKSLGLIRDSHIVPGQTLSDEDFER